MVAAVVLVAAVLLVAASVAPWSAEDVRAGPASAVGADREMGTYRLVDTWHDAPWTLTPGHYGRVADIGSAPDGTVFMLDVRDTAGRPRAIHVLEPDGRAVAVHPLPEQHGDDPYGFYLAFALDVGSDGTAHVLFEGPDVWNGDVLESHFRVDRMTSDGRFVPGFEIVLSTHEDLYPDRRRRYVDVAVDDAGRVLLLRRGWAPWCLVEGREPPGVGPADNPVVAIDVYGRDGTLLQSATDERLQIPLRLDVAPDGTTLVTHRAPIRCMPEPAPPGEVEPSAVRQEVGDPNDAANNGIFIFDASLTLQDVVSLSGVEDVAAGPGGVYVARHMEVLELRSVGEPDGRASVDERRPVFSGPTDDVYAAQLGRRALSLDVPTDGRLLMGMSHCSFQGYVDVSTDGDEPGSKGARAQGVFDGPEMSGPLAPIRVAADEAVALLQAPFEIIGRRPGIETLTSDQPDESQTVQRWRLHAASPSGERPRPDSQAGLCPDAQRWHGDDGRATLDVDTDGDDVVTIDAERIQRRAEVGWPRWTVWPGAMLTDPGAETYLRAVAADRGRTAVLDAGTGRVVIYDREGRMEHAWSVHADEQRLALPVDLAMRDGTIALADRSSNRVRLVTDDGRPMTSWATHGAPQRVALSASGDVVVLTDDGRGLHYDASGELLASWRLPAPDIPTRDLAVGRDGRVYVSFMSGSPLDTGALAGWSELIREAGVWVFERSEGSVPQAAPEGGCVLRTDKRAGPARIPLGATVGVTLTIDGGCPAAAQETQLVLVFDTSRSMAFHASMDRAKAGAIALLDGLGASSVEVALVTYDRDADVRLAWTRDVAAVRSAIAGLEPDGDTKMARGLEVAQAELARSGAPLPSNRRVVVITDGVTFDRPVPVAERLAADGIETHVVLYANDAFGPADRAQLEAVVGEPSRLHVSPSDAMAAGIARVLTEERPAAHLFERLEVVDRVPANMRLVERSVQPIAAWDPDERTLTWRFDEVPVAGPPPLRYRLEPVAAGRWPTNDWARGPYVDGAGHEGILAFPVPRVEVNAGERDVRAFLPIAGRSACLRSPPADVALVLDRSRSMGEPSGGGETKIEAARAAISELVDGWHDRPDGVRWGLVTFAGEARVATSWTRDVGRLDAALSEVTTASGTRIDLGLAAARRLMADGRPAAVPVVIVLSDGRQSEPPGVAAVRSELDRWSDLDRMPTIHAVALGADADQGLLREVIATVGGGFHPAPSTGDLTRVFRGIGREIRCGP